MTLHQAGGTRLTKTAATALTTAVTDPDPLIKVNEDLYAQEPLDGSSGGGQSRRLAFRAGEQVRTSVFNRYFKAPTITSVSPSTGLPAGGTTVTIRGENLQATAVTFGGTAATSVQVANDGKSLTCVTPAKAAGAVAVAVTTDAGTATKANGFTYA